MADERRPDEMRAYRLHRRRPAGHAPAGPVSATAAALLAIPLLRREADRQRREIDDVGALMRQA